ncbi:hypothetical protein AVEN_233802-1 [Araneus ventricosus]|uniref:Uncharacterized protein n=1 Tax=Araneus ventricosus TaxID=182803 RepID=A0A4Y2Q3L0_ARAVE|nr:hypothetical protein AVEN_233802-1 [Araneus ventricosus]
MEDFTNSEKADKHLITVLLLGTAQQLNYLDASSTGRWIERAGKVRWTLRSQDLLSIDYFLWGSFMRLQSTQLKTSFLDYPLRLQTRAKCLAAYLQTLP